MSTGEPAAAPTGIQAISKADIHRITSGQVVLDIQSAVKELVENALDAGARAIEIRFKEHGAEAIEVIDNGSGIREDNYASLALKHHTSKLSSFHDLTLVRTFGFRGEALSSLCELSEVQVVTATKEDEPVGTVLEMNRDGTIRSKDKRVARQRGTTVTITELFSSLPVRRRELLKNVKREFAKAQTLLQAYAIIARGVRWIVTNTVKGRKANIMTITGSDIPSFIRSNTSAVFGPKACTSLISLELDIPIQQGKTKGVKSASLSIMGEDEEDDDFVHKKDSIHVQGLISRPTHGSGRSASDRIFLYLNGRPWDSSRIVRAFNEVYKSFNSNQYPLVVADFTIQGDKYDVNVSPDKRTLFLHDEGEIIEGLKISLEEKFNPFLSTFTVNGANLTAAKDAATQSQLTFKPEVVDVREEKSDEEEERMQEMHVLLESDKVDDREDRHNFKRQRIESKDSSLAEEQRREYTTLESLSQATSDTADGDVEERMVLDSTLASWSPEKKNATGSLIARGDSSRGRNASTATIEAKLTNTKQRTKKWSLQMKSFAAPSAGQEKTLSGYDDMQLEEDDEEESEQVDDLEHREEGLSVQQEEEATQQRQEYQKESVLVELDLDKEEEEEREANLLRLEEEGEEESISNYNWKSEMIAFVENTGEIVQIHLDMKELRQRILTRSEALAVSPSLDKSIQSDGQDFAQAGIEEKDAFAVESTLSRSIDKADFAAMNVIGQFNLGFILVRRRKGNHDDVFIIDQHAADEKFNFETLQREARLKSQTLIRPRQLELPSSVEFVAAQHIDTLANHGFVVKVDEEAIPGSRVELIALPISKNSTFGVSDLEELLYKLTEVAPDSNRARSIRCSRLHNILASRACRKSVMIGKALSKVQMKVILQHMGEIEQPWNCPHGRPTLRHLSRLDTYCTFDQGVVNWQSLL